MKKQDEEADQLWTLIQTLSLSQLDVRMNILLGTQLWRLHVFERLLASTLRVVFGFSGWILWVPLALGRVITQAWRTQAQLLSLLGILEGSCVIWRGWTQLEEQTGFKPSPWCCIYILLIQTFIKDSDYMSYKLLLSGWCEKDEALKTGVKVNIDLSCSPSHELAALWLQPLT